MKQVLTLRELIQRGASHRAQRLSYDDLRQLRVAFWDIEASGLDADFGIILCAGIQTLGSKEVRCYRIDDSPTYKERPWDDSWVAQEIRDDLETHDVIVHHYGDRYDIPFLTTRLLGARQRILDTSAMCLIDTWWQSRHRLKLHSNRLAALISYLDTKVTKTGLDGRLWTRATAGDPTALDKVVEHNIHDVKALREVTIELAKAFKLRYTYLK